MVRQIFRRETSPYRIVVLALLLVALIWASPSEQTIGDLVKVVYVHGALVRVAEMVFLASGVLGLVYLIRRSDTNIIWCWALQKVAFVFWLFSFFVSLYVMRMAWGGINWAEPRFLASGRVLSLAIIAIGLCVLLERLRIIAAAGILMGIIVALEIATAGLQLHPTNPIGASPSLLTKSYYYAIVLVILALSLESTRLLLPHKVRQDALVV